MNPLPLRSWAAVAALWLTLGVACQKDPPLPACKNGECCWPGEVNEFVQRIDGIRVEYGPISLTFMERIKVPVYPGNVPNTYIPLPGAFICRNQWDEFAAKKLKNNTTLDATGRVRLIDSTRAYPYRVWGILYHLPNVNTIAYDGYAIRIERIEDVY